MNDSMRREFLKKLLFAPLLTGSASSKSYALSSPESKAPAYSSEIESKMREAYKNWMHKFGQRPEEFINGLKQTTMTRKSVSQLSKQEFKAGDTIDLNEILLGKTEAAIILNAYFS